MPVEVSTAIGQAIALFEGMNKKLLASLDETKILDELDSLGFGEEYTKTILQMNGEIVSATKAVGVIPELSLPEAVNIAENYSNNMKLFVKEWTKGEILKLRKIVEQNSFEGYRAEKLVKGIQTQFGVSKSKATFLAKQETSLLMSEFREQRYKEAGVDQYRWSTAGDSRVRDRHEKLDGKIFSWDSPPVIDDQGNRGHPGEAFGCRCVAIGIVNF